MAEQPLTFETLAIHAGQEPDAAAGSRALPIHQTTSFVFPSAESAADRFALAEAGPIYTRITNPTQGLSRIASRRWKPAPPGCWWRPGKARSCLRS